MSDQGSLDSQPASSQNAQVIPNDVFKAFEADRRALFTERIRAPRCPHNWQILFNGDVLDDYSMTFVKKMKSLSERRTRGE
ncbi:hypothetical protein KIN20_025467 [Parelaphostrongylus tenuis]|uniref:Uncharacterized protein n=1 Tax=Parelaphostrongylus tenuis TaxID=148309 RepID=A0AAD5MYH3_PARTN|nr:hypothetical protein KIN20_025467 [Parelaphostrongylus tenuis]